MYKVYNRIEEIAGNVITVNASGVSYRELAQVTSSLGTSLAQVIRLQEERGHLAGFCGRSWRIHGCESTFSRTYHADPLFRRSARPCIYG